MLTFEEKQAIEEINTKNNYTLGYESINDISEEYERCIHKILEIEYRLTDLNYHSTAERLHALATWFINNESPATK